MVPAATQDSHTVRADSSQAGCGRAWLVNELLPRLGIPQSRHAVPRYCKNLIVLRAELCGLNAAVVNGSYQPLPALRIPDPSVVLGSCYDSPAIRAEFC